MRFENEIWKDVKGFKGQYMVSSCGRVKTLCDYRGKERLMNLSTSHGYKCVMLTISYGNPKVYRVHRLVAAAFIPNPRKKPVVNHKNKCRWDNRIENLEWCTQRQNIQHALRTERTPPPKSASLSPLSQSRTIFYPTITQ